MIGFHRVYLTTRDRKYFEEDPFGNAYLGNYLGSLGMGFDAVQFIIKAGPDQITFLTAEDAKQLHINFEGNLPSQQIDQPDSSNANLDQKNVVVAVVTQGLMIRAAPDPRAPNVLVGVTPDYLPTGAKVALAAGHTCVTHIDGGHWCKVTVHNNGKTYQGWARSWYLMLSDGNRVGCKWGHDIFCG
jgi:hypothetical protein